VQYFQNNAAKPMMYIDVGNLQNIQGFNLNERQIVSDLGTGINLENKRKEKNTNGMIRA